MESILGQALAALKSGNEDLAWEIAQQDEDMLPSVTKSTWLEWAHTAILRRNLEAATVYPTAYYS